MIRIGRNSLRGDGLDAWKRVSDNRNTRIPNGGIRMAEQDAEMGRPDESWSDAERAWYEAMKTKCIAEMTDEPEWLNEPTVPADDLIELLDRLERESQDGRAKA